MIGIENYLFAKSPVFHYAAPHFFGVKFTFCVREDLLFILPKDRIHLAGNAGRPGMISD